MQYKITIPEHGITITLKPELATSNKEGVCVIYYEKTGSYNGWDERIERKLPLKIKNQTIPAHPNAHIEHPMQNEEEESAASPAPKDIF